jgi:hypothetical protein
MEKCVVDLFSATTQIKPDYFRALGTRFDQTQYPQNIEQSFSAELYHRFKLIMDLPVNSSYYNNLMLNFDITKAAVDSRPDLVLHENQANRNNQKMFVEVKTNPEADLSGDFSKLIMATDNYLSFNNSVLIVVNRPFANLLQTIYGYNDFYILNPERKAKIYIISVFHNPETNQEIDYNLYSIKFLPNTRIR